MKIIIKILLNLLIIFNTIFLLKAQDFHFSYHNSSSQHLNPALTGNHEYLWSFTNCYRNQWASLYNSYKTIYIGYDRQAFLYSQRFTIGGFLLNETSGPLNYSQNKFVFSSAFHKQINKNQIHIGFQFGTNHTTINYSQHTTPSQYDISIGYFNASLPSGELFSRSNKTYFEINTGILQEKVFNKNKLQIGISLLHINFPNHSFYNTRTKYAACKTFHADYSLFITKHNYLKPIFIFKYLSKANECLLGLQYSILSEDKNINFNFSPLIRNGYKTNTDALILQLESCFKPIRVIFSYDLTISVLSRKVKNCNAIEFSLIYYCGVTYKKPQNTLFQFRD